MGRGAHRGLVPRFFMWGNIMRLSKIVPSAIVLGMAAMAAQPAQAASFVGDVYYYTVNGPANNNSDFKNSPPTGYDYGVKPNMVQSGLSANDRPLLAPGYNAANPGEEVRNTSGSEISWWTPGTNTGRANVNDTITVSAPKVELGRDLIANPFADTTFFAGGPTGFGDGTSNANGFLTVYVDAVLTLDVASTVTFRLGSDDDAFLYLNGSLISQLGGIHEPTPIGVQSTMLDAGTHYVKLFYADRNRSQAELHFSLTAIGDTPVNPVPEPATWAMMIGGLGLVGTMMRRRKTAVSFA